MANTGRLRHGDAREDGKIFVRYQPSSKNGEYWVTPERFALTRLYQKVRYYEAQELKLASKPKKLGRYVPLYAGPRPVRRSRKRVIQKEIDKLPYAAKDLPDMNTPLDLTIIPNYTKYGITTDGTVYRVVAATRGKTAGMSNQKVTPVIHPRGHQWCVQLTDDDGKRRRLPIRKLVLSIFGDVETIS
jgi:hypothetical protein